MCYNDYVPKRGTEREDSNLNISRPELQAVVRTLPIGLYIKRGVEVSIGDGETSFYVPQTDTIEISYPQIQLALSKVADNSPHKEQIIRSILYHEVSHAFITPTKLTWNDMINVFEDERMETLLANYYHDVDFKSNVYRFNGLDVGTVPPATDKFGEFYNLVRFRSGKPDLLKRVEELIVKYASLNRNTPRYTRTDINCYNYYNDIMALYGDMSQPEKDNSNFEGDIQQGDDGTPIEGQQDGGSDTPDPNSRGPGSSGQLSNEQIKELFTQATSDPTTNELLNVFQLVLDNFSRKNKGGSAINGYSGVLNPRHANREDYKIFERAFTQKANNQFGTCHLNLFIDKSGSFASSETLVNQLLTALSLIEKKNPNFTLDVVFCGYTENHAKTPRERVLLCGGGNDISDRAKDIFRKLQKPSTYNYNIVLFDGDAFSDGCSRHHKNFGAFDSSNCTIISDRDNERYISKYIHSAKVIYTKEYTKELINHIINTLQRAFR
jgi:hypothetical protein